MDSGMMEWRLTAKKVLSARTKQDAVRPPGIRLCNGQDRVNLELSQGTPTNDRWTNLEHKGSKLGVLAGRGRSKASI